MPKRVLLFLLILCLLTPIMVQAQEKIGISELVIELWPEYDRPSMLVIYRVVLSPQTTLPVELTLRIPTSVGEPNAVAMWQNGLLNNPYDRTVDGEWAYITTNATSYQLQIEYYDTQLIIQDEQRHFEYNWPGDYSVDSLVVRVQEPIGTSLMRFSPDLGEPALSSDGLMYFSKDIGSIAADQTFTMIMDYQKSTDALSVESLQVKPTYPLSENTQGRVNLMDILPWILAALGVLLLVGGGWWYWQSVRDVPVKTARRRRRRSSPLSPQKDGETAGGSNVYCHQCGRRAASGDRYCRACGTRFRYD